MKKYYGTCITDEIKKKYVSTNAEKKIDFVPLDTYKTNFSTSETKEKQLQETKNKENIAIEI